MLEYRKSLELLYLDRTKVGDSGMQVVGTLDKLKELNLNGSLVTTEGVKHLRGLGQLRSLSLAYTNVNSKSLVFLADLLELRKLNLSGTRVRRKLDKLKTLTKLELLSLESNNIGNRAISKLPLFPNLQYLDLGPMDIHESKVSWLEARYPDTDVNWIDPMAE